MGSMTTATIDRDQAQQRAERLARLNANRAGGRPASPSGRVTSANLPARRRHPAKGSRITALALSVATTGGLAYGLAAADRTAVGSAAAVSGTSTLTGTAAPAATGAGTATAATAAPAATVTVGGSSASGAGAAAASGTGTTTYAGTTASTRWGPVQVKITVSGSQITDVTTVQYPSDRSRSVAINDTALPILTAEALQAQSAQIDTVSGATYTSTGYVKSLQSAIDQARAAGVLVQA
jgi:uncharacterized protein with FMN-binding domain